jgi:hypothetical protein
LRLFLIQEMCWCMYKKTHYNLVIIFVLYSIVLYWQILYLGDLSTYPPSLHHISVNKGIGPQLYHLNYSLRMGDKKRTILFHISTRSGTNTKHINIIVFTGSLQWKVWCLQLWDSCLGNAVWGKTLCRSGFNFFL